MNPRYMVNAALWRLGIGLRIDLAPPDPPAEVRERLARELRLARAQSGEFTLIEQLQDDSHPHPMRSIDLECAFATEQLLRLRPGVVLDVGSYRLWLIGLMAHFRVITVDVRSRESHLSNETMVTADARHLDLPPESVDAVTTLCSIEHFGLGRYGDPFDLQADRKAVAALVRTIRPGGHFIFSVPVTAGAACLAFNAHRIYTLPLIQRLTAGLHCREERFIKSTPARYCEVGELPTTVGQFDVYCGCYQKPGPA